MKKSSRDTSRPGGTSTYATLPAGRQVCNLFLAAALLFNLPACNEGGDKRDPGGEQTQTRPYSEQMAETVMTKWPDSLAFDGRPAKWSYDLGVILKGFESLWYRTGNPEYFDYIQHMMDGLILEDGTIRSYDIKKYNIDYVNNGKLLLLLYKVTGEEKYFKALEQLREQLRQHPRTSEGGFWHKQIYPHQMWLDGLYMGAPFYAEYAATFGEKEAFDDITKQFILMETHSRDKETGLLYHGWDESREQRWADPETGRSPNFWGRSMGWFSMALVDVLDFIPEDHPERDTVIAILNRLMTAVADHQEPETGLWFQVVDQPERAGNYPEASASCMFVYALAKGVRMGYLPERFMETASSAYEGILSTFVVPGQQGPVDLEGTVKVSGLGGDPYRDGSYEYYLSEPVITNDPKGVGAFILAAGEMELAPRALDGKGLQVTLDHYYNNERTTNAFGKPARDHYIWEQKSHGGYSFLGELFKQRGVKTASLESAPSAENLEDTGIYIIVDPDTEKETETPHYMQPEEADAIENWVKAGGVLVLLSNDAGNAEFEHFNELGERFGIRFNEDNKNLVENDQYEQGAVDLSAGGSVFKTARKAYIKELSSLQLSPPAEALVEKDGDVIMATAKAGEGVVFAIGDPWFYNEYVDGRKLPAEFQNYAAAKDLVDWLIAQASRQ